MSERARCCSLFGAPRCRALPPGVPQIPCRNIRASGLLWIRVRRAAAVEARLQRSFCRSALLAFESRGCQENLLYQSSGRDPTPAICRIFGQPLLDPGAGDTDFAEPAQVLNCSSNACRHRQKRRDPTPSDDATRTIWHRTCVPAPTQSVFPRPARSIGMSQGGFGTRSVGLIPTGPVVCRFSVGQALRD